MNRIQRRAAAAIAVVALMPALAGCYNGFDAGTQKVDTGGDSDQALVGDIQIMGANWVSSPKNPEDATLVATFINSGDSPDLLLSVETKPAALNPVGITGDKLVIPPKNYVGTAQSRVGYNSERFINAYGLITSPSAYIDTTFTFLNAGSVTTKILRVPSSGNYAGIVPNPEIRGGVVVVVKPDASPSAVPSSSATGEAPNTREN